MNEPKEAPRVCGNRPHVWRVPPGLTFEEWGTHEWVVCGYCGLRMKRTEARHSDGRLVSEPRPGVPRTRS